MKDINRLKVVLVERKKQENGLSGNLAKILLWFQNGVQMPLNHHLKRLIK